MDEEELGTTGKKITIANFFESIKKIDKVANDALESSEKSFEEIKVAKETLKGLQAIVTSLQTDVQALKENDKIRENERKDRILEQQDAIQKQEMVARAEGIKGEKGDRGAPGAPGAPGSRTTGEDRKNQPKEQGFFGSLFGGVATIGSLLASSPLGMGMMLGGPVGALLGGMGIGRFGGRRPRGDKGEKGDGNFLTRFFGDKGEVEETGEGKKKKKRNTPYEFIQEKGLKVTDVEDMFKRMVHVYNPDVQGKDGDYQGIKVSGTFKKKDDLSTEEFINVHPAFKISELKKIAKGLKKRKKEDDDKDKDEIKPEKKENKLLNFVKKGGVAGFLGRKIFGKKENKAQEVGETNPEDKDSSYSESFSYEGRLDPETLQFIPDEGSLPEGVPIVKAQQDYYQGKISMLEFDFRSDIRQGMTREEAIEAYGPSSNLYRFKENYNNTLEYGGYELDVGKHYDSIKNSLSGGKKKGKGQDSSLKGEKRGIKGVIGGVADALTGGFFNFDKRGNTKLQDFAQGTADTLTGGFFDFDKKGNTKFQDFQQGTADTLTGGIFDFDKKGSNKLQRFQQGFMDAMTGNLTDFDRKGGKTVGPTRAVTGIADFFTANMFDLDKRGELDLFGGGKKGKGINTYEKGEKKENKFMNFVKGIGDSIRNFDGRPKKDKKDEKEEKERISVVDYLNTLSPIEQGKEVLEKHAKWNKEFKENPNKHTQGRKRFWDSMLRQFMVLNKDNTEDLPKEMLLEFINRAKTLREEKIAPGGPDDRYKLKSANIDEKGNIQFEVKDQYKTGGVEPVLESDNKDLSSSLYQDLGVDNLNDTVSQLVTQNIAQNGNAVDQNTAIPVPSNEPQVSDAEIKNAVPNIPFIALLRGTSKKYSQITSSDDGSSVVAGYLD